MSTMNKKRKYSDSYLQFGFTSIINNGIDIPQGVLCQKTLGNKSMKPSLLARHMEKCLQNFQDKDVDFLKRKEAPLKKQRLDPNGSIFKQTNAIVKASYGVSLMTAKQKKAHTIGENLILPAAKEIVRCVIGGETAKKLNSISLSNNTVKRLIEDMSQDILTQVLTEIKNSKYGFAIQLDETTDVSNCAQLLVFSRYVGEKGIKEEMLINSVLEGTTKDEDIFKLVNVFFQEHGLKWIDVKGCTTDGAPAMLGRRSGFRARVLEVAPHVVFTHCLIHRYVLACKALPNELSNVLSHVIKLVNHVKGSALNSLLFKLLCEDFEADHSILLFHTHVRWLSRGNVTKRVYELRNELLQFFRCVNSHKDFITLLEDNVYILELAYLVDIFEAMNVLNLSRQGAETTICDSCQNSKHSWEKFVFGKIT